MEILESNRLATPLTFLPTCLSYNLVCGVTSFLGREGKFSNETVQLSDNCVSQVDFLFCARLQSRTFNTSSYSSLVGKVTLLFFLFFKILRSASFCTLPPLRLSSSFALYL